LRSGESGSICQESVAVNSISSPIGGECRLVPLDRDSWFVNPRSAGPGTTAKIGDRQHHFIAEVLKEERPAMFSQATEVVQKYVPFIIAAIVTTEEVERWTRNYLKDVPATAAPKFKVASVRSNSYDTAA